LLGDEQIAQIKYAKLANLGIKVAIKGPSVEADAEEPVTLQRIQSLKIPTAAILENQCTYKLEKIRWRTFFFLHSIFLHPFHNHET
jgi:hypothetical protein